MQIIDLEREERCKDNESEIPQYSGRSAEKQVGEFQNLENIGPNLPIILDIKPIKNKQSNNSSVILLDFILKILKNQRRTHSIDDLDDLVLNELSNLAPSKRLFLDTTESFIKSKNLLKSPSIFHQGVNKMRQVKSTKRVALSNKRRITEFVHSSVDSSICSYPSSSTFNSNTTTSSSLSTGLLHRVWKNGLPCFEFSIDEPDGVYVSNPVKVKSSVDRSLDYIYIFHGGGFAKKDSNARFIGKMKVSSSIVLDPEGANCIETEFVLFGSNEDYLHEMQGPCSPFAKGKGLVRKVAEILKPNLSPKPKYTHKTAKSYSQLDTTSENVFESELSGANEPRPTNPVTDEFSTNHELATTIVKDYKNKCDKEQTIGGWGLKFLGKNETNVCGERKSDEKKIKVLVPRGFHAGPVNGAFSVRERWNSGGACDCGGWDFGCPITVFNSERVLDYSPHDEPHSEPQSCNSADLFIEGARHNELALRLVTVSENIYLVYFQSNLSPLQSFSISVAIIHTQTSDLYPKI